MLLIFHQWNNTSFKVFYLHNWLLRKLQWVRTLWTCNSKPEFLFQVIDNLDQHQSFSFWRLSMRSSRSRQLGNSCPDLLSQQQLLFQVFEWLLVAWSLQLLPNDHLETQILGGVHGNQTDKSMFVYCFGWLDDHLTTKKFRTRSWGGSPVWRGLL